MHPTDTSRAASGSNTDITSLGGLTTPLSTAQGGLGTATAGGGALDNVLGYGSASGTGLLKRTGTGAYALTAGLFPVLDVVPKSATYTVGSTTGDNGKLFDLTGSFALTLPVAAAGLWNHYRKRDGSGQCTLVLSGSDKWEDGTSTPKAVYQEQGTVYAVSAGVWRFPPGGRERVVYVVPPGTAFSGVSSIALTTGFDADVAEVEVNIDNLSASASASVLSQLYQGGAYVTSGYSYAGPDAQGASFASDFSTSGTAIPLSNSGTIGTANVMSATVAIRNVQSATAGVASVEARGSIIATGASSSYGFALRARSASANAVGGLKLYPSTGTATGTYSQRITRA